MASVPLGPGTLTVGATPTAFSCEVTGGSVTHTYEDTSEARTNLCGDSTPTSKRRLDGFTFNIENDLSASGMYQYLLDHDLEEQEVTYTANTAWGVSWAGVAQLTLPDTIGADEYGAPIISAVTWAAVGALEFTAGTAPAAA